MIKVIKNKVYIWCVSYNQIFRVVKINKCIIIFCKKFFFIVNRKNVWMYIKKIVKYVNDIFL